MHHNRNTVIVKVLVAIVLFGFGCISVSDQYEMANVVLPNGENIVVDIAKTPREHERGLSGLEDIGEGMLFCFSDEETRYFWMFDMKVPLDVVWIRDDVIIGTQSNIQIMTGDIFGEINGEFVHADSTWTQFSSPDPADAALEMPVGYIESNGVELGERIVVNDVCSL